MHVVTHTAAGTYDLDPSHSRVGFVARHAMITKVRGSFDELEGTGFFDPDHPANSWIRLTIQASSVNTRNADRDAHLRSNDFFAVSIYPTIDFTSTDVAEIGEGMYRVTGNLTIRDVTRPITVDFLYQGTSVDPDSYVRIGFEGQATVNRHDWGLSWNQALETGGVLVGDKVLLEFDVSAIRTGD